MTNIDKDDNSENPILGQIRSEDHYYRSIIENNSFYMIKTDLEGRYTYMNPFFCQNFRIDPEHWLGEPSINLIIPADHQACIDTVYKCFATPGESHWVILRKPHHTGIVSTQWEFKLVLDQSGNPFEVLCIGHDITSLIVRQQELQKLVDVTAEQNKKLLNFTYIISHNIRSHVANIIGIINLNENGNEADKEISWNIIKKSITGLDSTIHNLNDIINIQTNTKLPVKRLYIKEEINRIIDSVKILFDEAETNITYHFDDAVYLDTNPAYLESIMLNLLTNALKYRSPQRPLQIDLSFEEKGEFKVLIFSDNGIGIDLETNADKVFGMYKTFHGNADAKGMGLFIVKTQIEAIGGKIEVDSVVDESTTFKVYFRIDESL